MEPPRLQSNGDILGLDVIAVLLNLKTHVGGLQSAVANRPAVRGQASTPAIVTGNQMGIDPPNHLRSPANQSVTVIVDNISAQITLTLSSIRLVIS